MVPVELLPGFGAWGGRLPALLAHPGPLWIWGEPGAGVSGFLRWLGAARGTTVLDDAVDPADRAAFFRAEPRGAAGAHLDPEAADLPAGCLALRLPGLEEDPRALPALLEALAADLALAGPLPPALGRLPCPGNLRGLHNRLLRWQHLGQLPEPTGDDAALPLEAEDLASNLHALERALLFRALRRSYGNRAEAASRLGVSRRHLYLLIARHGDPVRGEPAREEGPKRLVKQRDRQNSSRGPEGR